LFLGGQATVEMSFRISARLGTIGSVVHPARAGSFGLRYRAEV